MSVLYFTSTVHTQNTVSFCRYCVCLMESKVVKCIRFPPVGLFATNETHKVGNFTLDLTNLEMDQFDILKYHYREISKLFDKIKNGKVLESFLHTTVTPGIFQQDSTTVSSQYDRINTKLTFQPTKDTKNLDSSTEPNLITTNGKSSEVYGSISQSGITTVSQSGITTVGSITLDTKIMTSTDVSLFKSSPNISITTTNHNLHNQVEMNTNGVKSYPDELKNYIILWKNLSIGFFILTSFLTITIVIYIVHILHKKMKMCRRTSRSVIYRPRQQSPVYEDIALSEF